MAAMTTTTLSAAVGVSDLLIPLASATDVVAQGPPTFTETTLFCEFEAMTVRTINQGTARVMRGAKGTRATAHPSGAQVWVGPTTAYGLLNPSGTYSAPQGGYTPLVVIPTADIWDNLAGVWAQIGSGGQV